MWIMAAFALFGLHLAYTVKDRLGAAFLGFAITTLAHVALVAAPGHINGSTYGRRILKVLRRLTEGDDANSLIWMLAATAAGMLVVWFFAALSDDRKARNWDPDRPRRKARRAAAAA